jgi:hypothetical protein
MAFGVLGDDLVEALEVPTFSVVADRRAKRS